MPHALGFGRGIDARAGFTLEGCQRIDEELRFVFGPHLGGTTKLDDEKAIAGRQRNKVFYRLLLAAHSVKQESIDAFKTNWLIFEGSAAHDRQL